MLKEQPKRWPHPNGCVAEGPYVDGKPHGQRTERYPDARTKTSNRSSEPRPRRVDDSDLRGTFR